MKSAVDAAPFDPHCRRCPRLSRYLADIRLSYPDYFAGPVASFGDPATPLLVVGLAPGLHGANATGRPFTGDYAGVLLYDTLHRFGFSSSPESVSSNDRLKLKRARITNAVKCLPPQNKPTGAEIKTCNRFLKSELEDLGAKGHGVILALGLIGPPVVLAWGALVFRSVVGLG